jgi:hypothetical protein
MNIHLHPNKRRGGWFVVACIVVVALAVVVTITYCIYDAAQIPPRPPPDEENIRSVMFRVSGLVNSTNGAARITAPVARVGRFVLQFSTNLTDWQDREAMLFDDLTNRCGFYRWKLEQ